jgi:hypothetical protein
MNHTHLPREVLLPDGACRDMQGKKGDRVYRPVVWGHGTVPTLVLGPWPMQIWTVGARVLNKNWEWRTVENDKVLKMEEEPLCQLTGPTANGVTAYL